MVFQDVVLVDGRTHMLGRLASVMAKELLSGQKIVVVRCEQVVVSGSLVRNKVKFTQFLKKRTNTNPKKGPIHYRSPARMVWRTIRGRLRLKPGRRCTGLARLATEFGWAHEDLIKLMESKRISKSAEFYAAKKLAHVEKAKAAAVANTAATDAALSKLGYFA